MPNLIVERGREKGQSITLSPGSECIVGRDPASVQFEISDVAASRRHFQVLNRGNKWIVVDLGSRNGTFVNEDKVEGERELQSGDRVQVGETVFSFLEEEKAEPGKAGGLQGRVIGGYEIMERIGRGGMGTVYKARQTSMNRVVAIKFLSPKLSSNPAFVNQFRAEARAAGQLMHPNVVQALDVFELNGLHCFSMEFMEHGCVQDLLSKQENSRLTWEEAMPLLLDAVRGLVFAEKRGIIHRDIKPDNLMLSSDGRVKIGDLGLAKSAHENDAVAASGGSGIFGTPHFIAPEQAQGKPVAHSADIYSLGATYYRMISGRTPFSGGTVKEILRAQINDPHKPLTEEVPGFPPELSAIVDKMMAKKVEARYQSASQLLEDLEKFQLAQHIEQAGGIKSRKPFLVAMGVLGVALAGVVVWAATRDPDVVTETRTTTVTVTVGTPTGPVLTPEQVQEKRELDARNAFLETKIKEGPLGTAITLEKAKEWEALSREYEKLAAAHGDAEKAPAEARKRAREIVETLRTLEREKTEVLDKAEAWWRDTESRIKDDLTQKRWSAAVAAGAAALESAEWKRFQAHCPPAAEGWLKGLLNEAVAAANADLLNTQARANESIGLKDFARGVGLLEGWEKATAAEVTTLVAAKQSDGRLEQILDQAKTWREKRIGEIREALNAALDADKTTFLDAYRSVRHWPRAADDTGGPVFSYKFAEAGNALREATRGRLATGLYRNRAERKAEAYVRMQAAWDAWVKLLAERKLFSGGEEIKGLPGTEQGTRLLFDGDRGASAEGISLVKTLSGTSGSSKISRDWADLTPDEIFHALVQPKLDKIPPEVAAGLAEAFAELGSEEGTASLLDRAGAALADAAPVRAELTAIQSFAFVAKSDPEKLDQVVKAVASWRDLNRRTDFFVLADGRPAPSVPHLFADEQIQAFLDRWGADE